MKVVFHTHLAADFIPRIIEFSKGFPGHEFVIASGGTSLLRLLADAEVLVDHRVTAELLDAAPRLIWLFVPFTGVNGVQWELLEPRGIRVCNNHGNAAVVAERALALALAATGRIVEFDRGLRRGNWFRNESRTEPFVFWTSLARRRVSILGTGAIGQNIARLLVPFSPDLLGFRRTSDGSKVPFFSRVTTNLDTALEHAEICFITLPLTPETDGLIGENELALLKNCYLVNISRGEIILEKALFHALKSGLLAGAALDVWYRYPEPFHAPRLPSDLPFHELENLVLSPHAGSHTPEGKEGQLEGVLKNLEALLESGLPMDIAEPGKRY
jgi:phosphoglycerate dehydrogenase-like enzyme